MNSDTAVFHVATRKLVHSVQTESLLSLTVAERKDNLL